MPLWSATATPIALTRGVPVTVFDAESLSDAEESIAVAIPTDGTTRGADLTFTIVFGSAPTTVDYQLQVALNNVDAEYYDLGSPITATAGGKLTVSGVVARFARVKAVDADVQTVTSQIMVA